MSSLLGVGPVVAPVQETHVAHHWVGFNVEVQISINGNVQSVYSCIVTVSHFHETLGQFSAVTVVILVMQQPNKTNPIDATPTDKPYFTPHTISTHQNVKIGNQCIS